VNIFFIEGKSAHIQEADHWLSSSTSIYQAKIKEFPIQVCRGRGVSRMLKNPNFKKISS
jgi:hypothetical protein